MSCSRAIGALLLGFLAAVATATPYWVDYDAANGNFPEDEGWTRYMNAGGATRYFDNDALVLDSRGDPNITDVYAWYRPVGQFDPGPGEWLSVSWRLRTDELLGAFDPTVGVYPDNHKALFFIFRVDAVAEVGSGHWIAFEPGVYHDFEVRSADVTTYDLFVDGAWAYSGYFWASVGSTSFVSWGSNTLGGGSLTHWDGLSFGVSPEPSSLMLVLAGSLMIFRPRGVPALCDGVRRNETCLAS